jgi:hypothetical protein
MTNFFYGQKNAKYFVLDLSEENKNQKKPSDLKREDPAFQNILYFTYLGPDPVLLRANKIRLQSSKKFHIFIWKRAILKHVHK